MNIKNIRLKNKYGELLIEPKSVKFAEETYKSILQIKDARFEIDKDTKILSDEKQEIEYDGRPLFYENQEIHFTFIPDLPYENNEYSFYLREEEQFGSKIISGQTHLSGSINFDNCIGFTEIKIRDLSLQQDIFSIKTEIFPQKLDYKNDFKSMLNEITEIIYNLAFNYFRKTYLLTKPIDTSQKTLSQWFVILKYLFDNLIKNTDFILKNPNYKIVALNIIKPVSQVKKADKKLYKWLRKNKKYLKTNNINEPTTLNRYSPSHLPEYKKKLSYDTSENQFIVWGIKQIIRKIDRLWFIFYSQEKNLETMKKEMNLLKSYKMRLLRRLNDIYFKDVGDFSNQINFSTVLTMAPGYRDFYFHFLLLNKGLEIAENDIFNLDLKDIATLYEYWCFLKIIKILKESDKYELKSNDFIKIENKKINIGLKKGKESRVGFITQHTKEKINIYYNKGFATPTYLQKPDNFIEFEKEGYYNPFRYFFDAKYRFEREENISGNNAYPYSPPQDTIGQMHRYRDAILEKSAGGETYSNAIKSLGGIVLFPYPKNEDEFRDCNFYKSIDLVNIGAIPLHPGRENKLFERFLDNIFSKSAESNFDSMINYDRREYLKYLKEISEPVLVGMIRKNENKERINYLYENKKFYIHKTASPEAFLVKYVVIYNQKTKKMIGYSKVKKIYLDFDKKMVNPQKKEYIFYSTGNIKKLDIDFTLEGFGQSGYFYTNLYVFNKMREGKEKEILKLNDFYNIRMWREIKNIDTNCKIIRDKFTINQERKDISVIKFKFRYKESALYCMQDKEKRNIFYIGNNEEYSKKDMVKFSVGEDLYSFINMKKSCYKKDD
ncbi:hypothetical protein ES704_00910 [subsurface metagenome]|jgi:predicted component of viral defense system (DUF524 family)